MEERSRRTQDGLLPLLIEKRKQDPYLRLENSTRLLSIVGLNEITQSTIGKEIHENKESLGFALEILSYISNLIHEYGAKHKTRCALSMTQNMVAAKRFAKIDIQKYGLGEAKAQGNKDDPYYTSMPVVPYKSNIPLMKYLEIEEKIHNLISGGHMTKIPLEKNEDTWNISETN